MSDVVEPMADHEETFNLSYFRVIGRKVHGVLFIDAFYDRFLSQSTEIAEKFSKTDFDGQKEMLLLSIIHVSSYYSSGVPGHILEKLARRHGRDDLNIEPHLYDTWLECLLKTVETHDPEYDTTVGGAWQRVLTPGTEFMKSRYSD